MSPPTAVDYDNDLILITCASGKQSSHLLPHLHKRFKHLRLAVNSPSSEERLKKQYPYAEVIRAELTNPHEAARLLKGVTAMYQVGPSFHPHETEIDYNMIDAAVKEAKEGNFKHFVLSSVLNSQLRKMMNHDCKRYAEEYLIESGLSYTILQPTHFMDLFPIQMLVEQEHPVYHANWNPDIPFSYIALQDLGEAAAKVICERERHCHAQYPLVSCGPFPYTELVSIVSEEIGKDIRIEQRSYEDAVKALLNMAFGGHENVHPTTRDAAQRMILYYNYRGLVGNSNVLEWLLGRKPTSYHEWVRMKLEQLKQQ